jgi:alkylhydroperoxidase family enzyme
MGPRPQDFRIAPVVDPSREVAEILEKTLLKDDGSPINIFGVLAHHPRLLKRFNIFAGLLLSSGLLPAREREVVILRIGWNCRSVYEFGQHTVIGKRTGLTDTEIAALTRAPNAHEWSPGDRLLIALADDLCSDDCVSNETWDALRTTWNEAEMIELVMVAGTYRLVSGFLNSVGVQLDNGVPGWPEGTNADR